MTETEKYSPYINLIIRWLEASNVPFNHMATYLPEGILGRCHNSIADGKVFIEINAPTALKALVALAHEAGHWLGNEVFGYKPTSDEREEQAMTYGWRILVLFGADKVITIDEWLSFHDVKNDLSM